MERKYSEISLQTNSSRLLESSAEFMEMTGFSHEQLEARFQGELTRMLSAVDAQAAEQLWELPAGALCPWIFSLTRFDRRALPVMIQVVKAEDGFLRLRIHDASFAGEQTVKLGRRVLSLEESVPSGLCQVLFDEYLTILWHNQYYLEMLGYTEEQFAKELQYHATGYVHPDDSALLAKLLGQAQQTGQRMFTLEIRAVRRDGEVRTLLTSMSFTGESVNGVPVLYSVGIDITDQKRAQQLELDADHLRTAMVQASSYILEYDVPRRTLLSSEVLRKYLGFSENVENVPESLLETGAVAPESVEPMRKLFQKINDGAERAEGEICLDGIKGEETLWFRLRLTSIFDDRSQPIRAILLAEDITERHMIEMRYREEENHRAAMTYEMDFSFQFNLTTEKILSANQSKFPMFDFSRSDSCRELMRVNAASRIHPEDRAEYLKKICTETLREQFGKGVLEITLEFRAMDQDGEYRWNKGVVHIIREPVRGDICAYFYTKDIDQEKKQELELHRHAEQDLLTGLYNRYTVELTCDQMLEKLAPGTMSVMYMLDLDNFKALNDTYGHICGDEMLRQTAQQLKDIFAGQAVLGRLGGDEFAVFQPECGSERDAQDMAERICASLRSLKSGEGIVTASVGVAFAPQDGRTFSELYHGADTALYQAKRDGKNSWAVFARAEQLGGIRDRLPVSREWLLEESSDIIYVCDFYNYDLLYMNLGARRAFGIADDSYRGRKCYDLLQKRDHPCEFCTNHLLCREKFHCWEFRNEELGTSFLLRDRIVDWYGTPARIEFATDVTAMFQRNQELKAQVEIDQVIISCLRKLNGAKSLEAASVAVLELLVKFYKADRAIIYDYFPRGNEVLPRSEWARDGMRTAMQVLGGKRVKIDGPILDCIENRKNYLYERTEAPGPDTTPFYQALYDAGVTSQRGVPFYVNGQPAGVLAVDNPTAFRDEMTVLETLSYFISEELTRRKLSDSLAYLGYHDSLTGLWNRNHYVEYLDDLRQNGVQSLGVAVADLNALKDINKLRGHSQGDIVVKRAAELLQECFPEAKIFRLSGDEFVVHSENQGRLVFLDQIQRVQERASELQAHGISVGYAWGDRDIDCSQLTMQATDIMLMQKREYYRREAEEYTPGKHNNARLQELLEGLRKGHYQMYLQPKADCAFFKLSGAEALVRYKSPETGVIPPDRFIPQLEQEHMIRYIDLFIFEEVCRLLARWKAQGRDPLTVSLNFSRQTVLEPDLLKTLLELTRRYGVSEEYIEVEITESLGEYESSAIAEIGAGIKAAGFRLALDDFGSHYTNMAMLSAVPADVLKLDRGMVRDVLSSHSNQLVLKSILSLCRELNISSIAEGVETREQLELLQALQCDSIQGYLFGRPAPVEEFEENYLKSFANKDQP